MNLERDPLESELKSFRPHAVSPRLKQRIADRLANDRPAAPRKSRLPAIAWGLGAGFAMACLAIVILYLGYLKPTSVPEAANGSGAIAGISHKGNGSTKLENSIATLPSLQAYRLAFAQSPDGLDAILKKQSALVAGVAESPTPLNANAVGNRDILDSL